MFLKFPCDAAGECWGVIATVNLAKQLTATLVQSGNHSLSTNFYEAMTGPSRSRTWDVATAHLLCSEYVIRDSDMPNNISTFTNLSGLPWTQLATLQGIGICHIFLFEANEKVLK